MRKLPTHTSKLLLIFLGAILMLPSLRAQIEIKNDQNMHPNLMAKPEVMATELGLELLNFLDSCSLDTLRVTETYSDAMDIAVAPAADTIEWRYIATTLADQDSMYPDSAWEYGSAFDTCCFRIGGLEQLTTYIIQSRIWCVDSAKYTPWAQVLDSTRCPAPTEATPYFSLDGTSATMTFDVTTTAWEWVLQEKGAATAKHVVTDQNNIQWKNLEPETIYLWKVRVKCGDNWSDYSNYQAFETGMKKEACHHPYEHEVYAKDVTEHQASLYCDMDAHQYTWSMRVHGAGSWSHHTTTRHFHHWNNLEPGTKYEYKVKVKCGDVWSDYSSVHYFTTKGDACGKPYAHHMSAKEISYDHATTYCDMHGSSYHWFIRPSHSNYGWKQHYTDHGHHTWSGLRHSTKYEYKVKVKCKEGYWSDYSPTMYFHTHEPYDAYCHTPKKDHIWSKDITYDKATTHCSMKGAAYHWYMRPHGSKDWSHHKTTSDHHTWTNLKYNTKYEYKVKVQCHNNYWTDFSPVDYFHTHDHYGDHCTTPQKHHMGYKNVSYDKATTYCDVKGVKYHWFIRPYGSHTWIDKETSHSHYNWTNLKYGTRYEYKVKIMCADWTWTGWSPTMYFDTHDHYDDHCSTPQKHHMGYKDVSYDKATTYCDVKGVKYHWFIRPYGSHTWIDKETSYSHHNWTNLKYGTRYEYKVKIMCADWTWTGWSPTMYFDTHDHYDDHCSTPQKHHMGYKDLSYDKATTYCDVKGVKYHWFIRPYGSHTWIDKETSHSHYNWTNLKYGTRYEYKVKIMCADWTWTGWSPTMYFDTHDHYDDHCSTPQKHHMGYKDVSYDKATTYCDVKGGKYHWYIRPQGSHTWIDKETSHSHYNWTNLKYGTRYEYKVKIMCADWTWTGWSPTMYFDTHDHYGDHCATPQKHHMGYRDLTYDAATTYCNMDGKKFHWYIRPYGSHTWIDKETSSNHHSWSNLKYGTRYEYKVKVMCHDWTWTGWSPVMYFDTHDHYGYQCSAPGSYDFRAVQQDYNLFRIYIHVPFEKFTSAIRIPGEEWAQHTTYADNIGWGNLQPNTLYEYRVKRTCSGGGESGWSNIKTFWTTGSSGRSTVGGAIAIESLDGFEQNINHRGDDVQIYPSPAHTHFSLAGVPAGAQIRVLNMHGQTVISRILEGMDDQISVHALENGYYQVLYTMPDGQVQSKKLAVLH